MQWKWECPDCSESGYRFSHIAGTIFENTNKALLDWFRVIHLMLTSKKGISALQIQRMLGFGSYRTACYMCHRIGGGLVDKEFRKLVGIVEVDETFVGGKAKNRHWDKRGGGGGTGGVGSGKTAIVGAVKRKGNVVARIIANVQGSTLTKFVRESVSVKVSLLRTDQYPGYNALGADGVADYLHLRDREIIASARPDIEMAEMGRTPAVQVADKGARIRQTKSIVDLHVYDVWALRSAI